MWGFQGFPTAAIYAHYLDGSQAVNVLVGRCEDINKELSLFIGEESWTFLPHKAFSFWVFIGKKAALPSNGFGFTFGLKQG
jgi:hypothetical protein